jgi:hypothetical protein
MRGGLPEMIVILHNKETGDKEGWYHTAYVLVFNRRKDDSEHYFEDIAWWAMQNLGFDYESYRGPGRPFTHAIGVYKERIPFLYGIRQSGGLDI